MSGCFTNTRTLSIAASSTLAMLQLTRHSLSFWSFQRLSYHHNRALFTTEDYTRKRMVHSSKIIIFTIEYYFHNRVLHSQQTAIISTLHYDADNSLRKKCSRFTCGHRPCIPGQLVCAFVVIHRDQRGGPCKGSRRVSFVSLFVFLRILTMVTRVCSDEVSACCRSV